MNEEKHQDALRTIGEVAAELGVATHVLRFWESKFAQIKPQKRRGRRYYDADAVNTIKTIKELLYEQGYTVKGVRKFLSTARKEQAAAKNQLQEITHNEPENMDLFENLPEEKTPNLTDEKIQQLTVIYNKLCAARTRLKELA